MDFSKKKWLRRLDGKNRLVLPSTARKILRIRHLVLIECSDGALVLRPYVKEVERYGVDRRRN